MNVTTEISTVKMATTTEKFTNSVSNTSSGQFEFAATTTQTLVQLREEMSHNLTTSDESGSGRVFAIIQAVILSLFIITSLIGNIYILASSFCCTREKMQSKLYLFCNHAAVNVLATVNMIGVLLYTILDASLVGELACKVQSFTIQMMNIELPSCLLLILIECLISVVHSRHFALWKSVISSVAVWLSSAVIGLPILLDILPAKFLPGFFQCGLQSGVLPEYTLLVCTFAIFTPCACILIMCVVLWKFSCRRNKFPNNDCIHNTSALAMIFMLFYTPYLILLYGYQIWASFQLVPTESADLWLHKSVVTVFTCCSFIYPCVVPFVFIKSKLAHDKHAVGRNEKDHRQSVAVTTEIKSTTTVTTIKQSGSFRIPVLYPTSEGVHVTTIGHDDVSVTDATLSVSGAGHLGRRCDVDLKSSSQDFSLYSESQSEETSRQPTPLRSNSVAPETIVTNNKKSDNKNLAVKESSFTKHKEITGQKKAKDVKNKTVPNKDVRSQKVKEIYSNKQMIQLPKEKSRVVENSFQKSIPKKVIERTKRTIKTLFIEHMSTSSMGEEENMQEKGRKKASRSGKCSEDELQTNSANTTCGDLASSTASSHTQLLL